MMRSGISLFGVTALIVGLSVTSACSQIKPPDQGVSTVYVGSTPCDSIIFSLLQIPSGEICEFIKWTLNLQKSGKQFHLTALYGESQPNTNGFKGGGKTLELSGQFTLKTSAQTSGPKPPIYILNCRQLRSPLWLVEMDDNILHFTDSNTNFLVGNGGWGYVLNRLN